MNPSQGLFHYAKYRFIISRRTLGMEILSCKQNLGQYRNNSTAPTINHYLHIFRGLKFNLLPLVDETPAWNGIIRKGDFPQIFEIHFVA
tara:strand:+ start:383 stop:649 length:267 start_codon:yes stop_codon:yes gene_type:complete